MAELATLLEQRAGDVDSRARASAAILQSVPHREADAFAAIALSVVGWANEETGNLRWRADAIRMGQNLDHGRGVPDLYVDEAHERALIAAFVPSHLGLDSVYEAWVIAKAEAVGRALGEKYLAGEDVSVDLYALRYRAHYESIAAGFFNTLGDESTAYLPLNIDIAVWQGAIGAEEDEPTLDRYAHAFAAATRSDGLHFTVEELFTRDDPLAELNEKYAAALLFTAPGIAADWLQPAAEHIVVGKPYVAWVTSPEVVAAIVRGLTQNLDVAAQTLTQPQAVDYLLRRSTVAGDEIAAQIGELLVLATTETADAQVGAEVAGATIAAIGSGEVHPHPAIMPYVAIVGGSYIDELATSLVDSVPDPTYSPRFEVSRATARAFVREVMRDTEGYATMLAASQAWIQDVIAPADVTTFEDYTTWVQNKTDDVGRLLATIISADEVIALEDAAERARREAMLLDVVKALGQVGTEFTGPASVVLGPSVDFMRSRADELLDNDYVGDAFYDNQLFQETLIDELDAALYDVIRRLELVDGSGELDPGELELKEGAVRSLLRSLIAAELLTYSIGDIRPEGD